MPTRDKARTSSDAARTLAFPFFWLLQTENMAAIVLAMTAGYPIGWGAVAGAQGPFFRNCSKPGTATRASPWRASSTGWRSEDRPPLSRPRWSASPVEIHGWWALFVIATQVLTIIGVAGAGKAKTLEPVGVELVEPVGAEAGSQHST